MCNLFEKELNLPRHIVVRSTRSWTERICSESVLRHITVSLTSLSVAFDSGKHLPKYFKFPCNGILIRCASSLAPCNNCLAAKCTMCFCLPRPMTTHALLPRYWAFSASSLCCHLAGMPLFAIQCAKDTFWNTCSPDYLKCFHTDSEVLN